MLISSSVAFAETVEDVFDAYRNAVKNRQYSSLAKYATTESVKEGYHVMNDFQRANFLKYFDNNPYYVSFRGKTEAIIYFKETRNGTASPYIFTKEASRWKIDFVKYDLWLRHRCYKGKCEQEEQ